MWLALWSDTSKCRKGLLYNWTQIYQLGMGNYCLRKYPYLYLWCSSSCSSADWSCSMVESDLAQSPLPAALIALHWNIMRTWFSWYVGDGLIVGLDDLHGLFDINDSMILWLFSCSYNNKTLFFDTSFLCLFLVFLLGGQQQKPRVQERWYEDFLQLEVSEDSKLLKPKLWRTAKSASSPVLLEGGN